MNNPAEIQPTDMIPFFKSLAKRLYHENDLSDMVYALCESNVGFRQFFINFFFKDAGLKAGKCSIEREVSWDDGSRPDFVIRSSKGIYFVEVKIWDGKHHFHQYEKTLQEANHDLNKDENQAHGRLGYIANYAIEQSQLCQEDKEAFDRCGCQVKKWSDFIAALEAASDDWVKGADIRGFVEYCKDVCPSFEDEQVNSFVFKEDDFKKAKERYDELERFLTQGAGENHVSVNGHTIKVQKYRVANKPTREMGFYFKVVDETSSMTPLKMLGGEAVYGWAGWRLTPKEHPGFCIDFYNQKGWSEPVFERLGMKNESWLSFGFDVSISPGIAFLEVTKDLLSGKKTNKDEGKDLGQLCAIRKLPLFLRQRVFPLLRCEGFRIEGVWQKDSFNPSKWCGEYFKVIKYGKDEKEISRYWVGVYYDDGRQHPYRLVCEKIGETEKPLECVKDGETVNAEALAKELHRILIEDEKRSMDCRRGE